ncbi:MAG: EAL domain-containing protein [Methylococcales bacterium]|nr:EAL domain-containing protein [Methylococcales bacterium]
MLKSSQNQSRGYFKNSLRHKFAAIFSSVLLVMMVVLAGLLYQQERDFLYEAAINQSRTLASTLASGSTALILSHDVVGLAEMLQGFDNTPDLKRAYILSLTGEVLSSTQTKEVGLFVSDVQSKRLLNSPPIPQILLANTSQIDVATPIFSGSRHIGWSRVEMSMNGVNENLHAVLIRGIAIIIFFALIVVLIGLLSAQKLTKRLNDLVHIFTAVAKGQRTIRAEVVDDDEVGLLASGFNTMLDELSATEYEREQITRFYGAWIACNDVIIREIHEAELLNEICIIIARQVGFKLVLVGMVNDEKRIDVVASSDPNCRYLQNFNVSIDANLPEGRGPMGRSIRGNHPIIFNDVLKEQDAAPWWIVMRETGIHASAAFPIIRAGGVVGAMCLYSTELNYFTEELITLIHDLTEDISYALDNLDRTKLQSLHDNELRIAAAAFESQESFMVTDSNNIILRVNGGFTTLTGYTADDVVGKNPRVLSSGRHNKEFYEIMWNSLLTKHFWQGEVWNCKKNGHIFPEWICITAISNAAGEIVNYVATSNDISQHKADEDRIRQLAFYDELTNLPNRTLLFQRLNLALNTSQRYQKYGALIFLDLDHFKVLNDTLGHTLGDQLIVEVSKRLQRCTRKIDTVARLGGDEFIVILEHLDTNKLLAARQAQSIAEKIRQEIAECYLLNVDILNSEITSTIEYHSSCSIGLVIFSGLEVSADDLLKYADLAMYHAKKIGRNQVSIFAPEMQQALIDRTQLETDLRSSIVNGDEFTLYYQAQVDNTGRILGAEALVRWNHPVRGHVSPAEFIPLAEETGMIIAIGTWVLREGFETVAGWATNPETAHLKLAINVSSRQLAQENFVEHVKEIIAETGVNPHFLKLEITESMVVNNVDDAIAKMHALKELGISFSMDDFGTGYSSLSYLQKLPLDQLKIDQSFVRNLSFDGHDSAIVKTIINLGENLSLNIIAEGVETAMQCDYLSNFGCLVFQGYLFGRPLPLSEFNQTVFSKSSEQIRNTT